MVVDLLLNILEQVSTCHLHLLGLGFGYMLAIGLSYLSYTSGKGIQSLEKTCPIPPKKIILGRIGQIFSRDWIPFPLVLG